MANRRVMAPSNVRYQSLTANGRQYIGTAGTILNVVQHDADYLIANGWIPIAQQAGPTASRPKVLGGTDGVGIGFHFYDTDLATLIVSGDQGEWRSPVSGAVV